MSETLDLFAFDKLEKKKGEERLIFFDLETKYLAHEVGGWENVEKLQVACAVTYTYPENTYTFFLEKEYLPYFPEAKELSHIFSLFDSASLIIGFNILRFDLQVLKPYMAGRSAQWKTLDLLKELEKSLGHRVSLDQLASQNLNQTKLASGVEAVKWFKERDFPKLLDYCRKDVEITKEIYFLGKRQGFLYYRDKSNVIRKVEVCW